MRKAWLMGGAVALVGATAIGAAVARAGATQPTPPAPQLVVSTAPVQTGALSAVVSLTGALTHRARADGSPYTAINQARGTYTALPDAGAAIACGDVVYRVDDRPVVLLCGTVPAYRDVHEGDVGNDVRQLNTNLHALGYDLAAGVDLGADDDVFTERTRQALEALGRSKGVGTTGVLGVGDTVVLPEPVRIANVSAQLGGPAQPGAPLLDATSDVLEVHVDLDASQRGAIEVGQHAQVTLPGHRSASATVSRIGTVAQVPSPQGGGAGGQGSSAGPEAATTLAVVTLDDPAQADGLDWAPVRVDVTTEGVADALSVPLTAIVGRSGGGFAVEVVRDGGRHELAAVELGLVDTTAGRVQVTGDLHEGDLVVVPTS